MTLLEAGATEAEVSAITGQSMQNNGSHYARQVNERKLAAAAILKWELRTGEREFAKPIAKLGAEI